MPNDQCDGCVRGLKLYHGIHYDGKMPVQTCDRGRYDDTKTHMVSVNGKAVFVTIPAGDKPTINGEDLHKIFGISIGSCVKIG